LGRGNGFGKIVHGDNHATSKVKTSALTGEVRKRTEIAALLVNPAPPDPVLNRLVASASSISCRRKAIEKDDLSLLSGEGRSSENPQQGIFTVIQLSYTFRPRRRSV
jgi:hypothetical protein